MPDKHFLKSTVSTLLVLMALLVSGCGDSDNFVFTTPQNAPAAPTTGNLVFRFQQTAAQRVPDNVPNGTTTLRFDLFSTNPPAETSLVATETRNFESVIILEDVPSNVVSVLVTAFDENDNPLITLGGTANVIIGGDSEVDLDDAVPIVLESITVSPDPITIFASFHVPYYNTAVNFFELVVEPFQDSSIQASIQGLFSNDSSADLPINASTTSFSGLENIAKVTEAGLFFLDATTELFGSATVTATYTLNSSVQDDSFTVNSRTFLAVAGRFDFDTLTVDLIVPAITSPGGYAAGYVGVISVTGSQTVLQSEFNEMTFELETPVNGIAIDGNSGVITAGSNIPSDTPVFVLVTAEDSRDGQVYTSRLELRVNPTDIGR
jgi:hypothetical protein